MTEDKRTEKHPPLAIAAGAIGALLTLTLIAAIAWQMMQRNDRELPAIVVEQGDAHAVPGGYVVEFTARNSSAHTASDVTIEATIAGSGGAPMVSTVVLDFVPGNSSRNGGMFLPADWAKSRIVWRALGYAEP